SSRHSRALQQLTVPFLTGATTRHHSLPTEVTNHLLTSNDSLSGIRLSLVPILRHSVVHACSLHAAFFKHFEALVELLIEMASCPLACSSGSSVLNCCPVWTFTLP